jgi:hypothetical protein
MPIVEASLIDEVLDNEVMLPSVYGSTSAISSREETEGPITWNRTKRSCTNVDGADLYLAGQNVSSTFI